MDRNTSNEYSLERVMKNLALVLHILIFAWVQVASVQLHAQDSTGLPAPRIIPPRPAKYKPPRVRVPPEILRATNGMPETDDFQVNMETANGQKISFWKKFKTLAGENVEIHGRVIDLSTLGEDYVQALYEIQLEYGSKVEVVLAMPGHAEASKRLGEALKQKEISEGNQPIDRMVLETPPQTHKKILEIAAKEAEAKKFPFKTLWTRLKVLADPVATRGVIDNAGKILVNQYEKPTPRDMKVAIVAMSSIALGTAIGLVVGVGGVDPGLLAATTTAKILFAGSTAMFGKTILKVLTTPIEHPFKILSGLRKTAQDMTYMVGSSAFMSGGYGASQFATDSVNMLVDRTVVSDSEKKFTAQTRDRLMWFTFGFNVTLGLFGSLGIGSLATQLAFSIFSCGLMLAYAYKAKSIEKFVEISNRGLITMRTRLIDPFKFASKMKAPILVTTTLFEPPLCAALFH